jgi:hypothetical protein
VLPSPADRQLVFWKTSNKIFHLGLADTDVISSDTDPIAVTAGAHQA